MDIVVPLPDAGVIPVNSKAHRMGESSSRRIKDQSTSGVFNYLDETALPSLFRNGKVLTRRDVDGNDYGTEGLSRREVELNVCDARTLSDAARPTCDGNGFELLDATLVDERIDFFDHESIVHATMNSVRNW